MPAVELSPQSPQNPAESQSSCTQRENQGNAKPASLTNNHAFRLGGNDSSYAEAQGMEDSGREGRDREEHADAGRGGRREIAKEQRPWHLESRKMPYPIASAIIHVQNDETKYLHPTAQQSSLMSLGKEEGTNVIKGYYRNCSTWDWQYNIMCAAQTNSGFYRL